MELSEFLAKMDSGEEIEAGSEYHLYVHELSQEALRITMEMNNAYHSPEDGSSLFARSSAFSSASLPAV